MTTILVLDRVRYMSVLCFDACFSCVLLNVRWRGSGAAPGEDGKCYDLKESQRDSRQDLAGFGLCQSWVCTCEVGRLRSIAITSAALWKVSKGLRLQLAVSKVAATYS